jgi:hypothetical protein
MSFFSWLRIRTLTRARLGKAPHRRVWRFRPQLEWMEDRCLLSTVLTVTNTLDSGKGSLRYEIAHADKNKNTINFNIPKTDPGYNASTGAWTITLTSGELDITTGLTIRGPGAGQLTVSGGGASRVFEVEPNLNVTLSGLTVSGGTGVAVAGGSTHFDGFGGGIENWGTLTVSGCTLSGNSASIAGGGIDNDGILTVNNGCSLSGNIASIDGGGIDNETGAALTVTNSVLSGNSAAVLGGGINNGPAAVLTVTNSMLSGNSANSGGGIFVNGTGTVSNSVFTKNTPDNIFGPYTDGGGNTFS